MSKKKVMKVISILCVTGVFVAFAVNAVHLPVVYPTRSSSKELTLVRNGGWATGYRPIVTLSNYIDGQHVADHVLTVKNGLHVQEPQRYRLPTLDQGTIILSFELGDNINSSFILTYDDARRLYRNGLLIYIYGENYSFCIDERVHFYDSYIHFISGRERVYYFREAHSHEWQESMNISRIKRFSRYDPKLSWYSGWRENEWIKHTGS